MVPVSGSPVRLILSVFTSANQIFTPFYAEMDVDRDW